MGLSNEERFVKIAYAIRRINNKWERVKERVYETDAISWQALVDGFWPAFLQGGTGGGFSWIFGSTLISDYASGTYLPHIAMASHNEQSEEERDDEMSKEAIRRFKEDNDEDGLKRYKNWLSYYSTYKCARKKVTMPGNLHDGDCAAANSWVLELWVEMEYILYALCRYKDEFSAQLKTLHDHVSKVMGVCFDKFATDEVFLKSYLLHQLGEKLITIEENDALNRVIVQDHLYHSIRCASRYDKKELLDLWRSIQFTKPTVEKRLDILLYLINTNGIDATQSKKLLAEIGKMQLTDKPKRLRKIKKQLAAGAKAYEKREEQYRTGRWKEQYCHITEKSAYDLPYPFADKPVKKKK